MTYSLPFAILAPVPLEHLESALEHPKREEYIAFGTRKWEFFSQKLEALRHGSLVAALIYPSHEGQPAEDSFVVSWFGMYIGYDKESTNGVHTLGMQHRPASTETDTHTYYTFWYVKNLHRLTPDKCRRIGEIQGFKGGWRKDAPPRGPELVTMPKWLKDET